MRLNLIRTGCKPFGLHQAISKCLIKLLLKLIVKTIYLNTPNNISVNKQSKPISRFPRISYHFSSLAHPRRTNVCRCTISPNLHPPPHYLVGPRWFVLILKIFWVFLYFDWFGHCYILISSRFGYVVVLK